MLFFEYLLTLNGKLVTLWIDQLSVVTEQGRLVFTGYLEVHMDFVLLYPDDGMCPSAFLIRDLKCIEVVDDREEDDIDDAPEEEDIHAKFERYYREQRG